MKFTTRIRVVLEGPPPLPLPGVTVQLYDRDRITPDDLLGAAVTDAMGEAEIHFGEEDFFDLDEYLGRGSLPDLYVLVLDREGRRVLSTRSQALPDEHRKRLQVMVPRQLALKHGLLPPGHEAEEPPLPRPG